MSCIHFSLMKHINLRTEGQRFSFFSCALLPTILVFVREKTEIIFSLRTRIICLLELVFGQWLGTIMTKIFTSFK